MTMTPLVYLMTMPSYGGHLFWKSTRGTSIPLHISPLSVECRGQETLFSQVSVGIGDTFRNPSDKRKQAPLIFWKYIKCARPVKNLKIAASHFPGLDLHVISNRVRSISWDIPIKGSHLWEEWGVENICNRWVWFECCGAWGFFVPWFSRHRIYHVTYFCFCLVQTKENLTERTQGSCLLQ